MKRIIVVLLIAVLACTMPMRALAISIEPEMNVDVNLDTINQIDELYALRNHLIRDLDNNITEIQEIDQAILSLGAEQISTPEVMQKLGMNVTPQYNVSSTNDVRWTSTRVNTTYRGNVYELQVITGVPTTSADTRNSDLISTTTSYAKIDYGAVEALKNTIKVVIGTVTGGLGVKDENGNTIVSVASVYTLFDLYSGVVEGMSRTSEISNVDFTYTTNIVSNVKFVFVKPYGTIDTGNQVLCYVGNYVDYTVGITQGGAFAVDGENVKSDVDFVKRSGVMQSANYSSFYNIAAENYWDHTQGVSILNEYHDIRSIKLEMIEGSKAISVPYVFANIS